MNRQQNSVHTVYNFTLSDSLQTRFQTLCRQKMSSSRFHVHTARFQVSIKMLAPKLYDQIALRDFPTNVRAILKCRQFFSPKCINMLQNHLTCFGYSTCCGSHVNILRSHRCSVVKNRHLHREIFNSDEKSFSRFVCRALRLSTHIQSVQL